jgi:hypothetical protein
MAGEEKKVIDDQIQEEITETTEVVEEQEEVTEEQEEPTEDVEVPKKLVATYPILYQSRQYKVGEILPANNHEMVEAWLEAGTAKWIADETNNKAKAQPRTAEPGQPGEAVASESEDGDNLVGKVPKTNSRRKK